MDDKTTFQSINEPGHSELSDTPVSINEPPRAAPPILQQVEPEDVPEPEDKPEHMHMADPDDLEEEIEQAREDDEFTPTHKHTPPKKRKR